MDETFAWQNRVRLVEEVAQVLRERIYRGDYPPGKPLRQVEISADLKISRTPLREALRLLEREGLVSAETARGVNVVNADFKQLMDAYALREMVDGLAARLAAQRLGERAGAALRAIVARQREALAPWQPQVYTAANVDFHATIIELADNAYLSRQLPIVHMTSQVFAPRVLFEADRARTAIDEHLRIVESIEQGDGEAAEALARAHIRNSMARLRALGAGGEDWVHPSKNQD
ncbi:GntR family transcriptional regulator [Cupriavidus sp. USMAA2-4]|uniref:GntR family transcriptional regulator n=1 Tax=Cupriavidus malaysiensis TaxID=367825 RepID=A0ABM6F1G7_9BURK|nr:MULTISPECIES: GntR family transcriptional regulator [Cupriavidus]AOY91639.1 GntR family transcriptional regulator [Cupriavidus sp. USMAA2-4]AOY98811.1 GntR family transcriptional regulator [Cupriavidus sp. USMAHM13]AOZ05235.1 GntR family transcriptional regulator [Cupriavidus malaysiensis]